MLFICDGNVARSQEAELYFNMFKKVDSDIATSAGVNVIVGKPIAPAVLDVMAEVGISMDDCYRKQLSESSLKGVGIVVSFKSKEESPVYASERKDVRYWDVLDPRYENMDFHRKVRDDIKTRVTQLIDEIYAA